MRLLCTWVDDCYSDSFCSYPALLERHRAPSAPRDLFTILCSFLIFQSRAYPRISRSTALGPLADSAWVASDVLAPHQHLDARFTDLSRRYVDDALAARVAAAEDGVRAAAAVVARVEGAQRAVTAQAETLQAQVRSAARTSAMRF